MSRLSKNEGEVGVERTVSQEPDPDRWKILGVCLATSFLTMMDISIVNVALPTITTALDASTVALQLMVAGYTLTFALTLVPAGRIGDAGYRRQLLLGGLGLFAAASLVAALAPNDAVLAGGRLVQGAAAGMVNPQGMGLTQQVFSREERGRAFGFNGAVIGVSNTLGPVIGGLIIAVAGNANGWRFVLGISVPIALGILYYGYRLVPNAERAPGKPSLDGGGLLAITVMTLGLMMPFINRAALNENPGRWRWLLVALVGFIALYLVERHVKLKGGSVIIDLKVLTERSFRNGTVVGVLYFAGLNSVMLITTLLLQNGMGYSALQAGFVSAPFALGSAFVAARSGRLVSRFGRPLVVAGLVVAMIGIGTASFLALLSARGVHFPVSFGLWMGLCMLVAGCGGGAVSSPNLTLTMQNVPVNKSGTSSSMMQVGQRLGSSLGQAVALSVYYSVLAGGGLPGEGAHWTLLITAGLFALALCQALVDAFQRGTRGIENPTARRH